MTTYKDIEIVRSALLSTNDFFIQLKNSAVLDGWPNTQNQIDIHIRSNEYALNRIESALAERECCCARPVSLTDRPETAPIKK